MQIVHVRDDEDARWDAYVAPRARAVTDLAGWRRVLHDAYGLKAHFLAAVRDDRICGTLGLFEIRHPIFGHYLTTAPYGNDGGLHADHDEARDALVAHAQDL